MELAVPDFVLDARKKLPRTDYLGPVDCRIRANPVRPISFPHIAGSDSIGYLICRLPSNFRDFTWLKFSDHNLLSLVLKDQKLFLSLARRVPLTNGSVPHKSTVYWSKGHALQLTYGLDFLSIQAYRLWMEYPSREKDESSRQSRIGYYFRPPLRRAFRPTARASRSARADWARSKSADRRAAETHARILIRAGRSGARRPIAGDVWRADFDAGRRVSGLDLGHHRNDHRRDIGLLRRVGGSLALRFPLQRFSSLPEHSAGHRDGRVSRPRPEQPDPRALRDRVGGIRAIDARAGPQSPRIRFRHGGARAGRKRPANHRSPYSTERDPADDRAGEPGDGGRRPRGSELEFPGPRRAASRAELGSNAQRRSQFLARRASLAHLSWTGGDAYGHGVQFRRRRPA